MLMKSDETEDPRDTWEVVVGNIGQVYTGNSFAEAVKTYRSYCDDSDNDYGRAAGETVTLFRNDYLYHEHKGKNHA